MHELSVLLRKKFNLLIKLYITYLTWNNLIEKQNHQIFRQFEMDKFCGMRRNDSGIFNEAV